MIGLAASTATTVREVGINKTTDRQRAAGPGKRTQREKLASPVQVGPPVTDQSAGSPSTVCFQPGTGSVQPVPGPGTQRFARGTRS